LTDDGFEMLTCKGFSIMEKIRRTLGKKKHRFGSEKSTIERTTAKCVPSEVHTQSCRLGKERREQGVVALRHGRSLQRKAALQRNGRFTDKVPVRGGLG